MDKIESNILLDEPSFYKQLGFLGNPFLYINADEEELLVKYFVPPPYFQSVWGDPKSPTSCVVFAPRGGGKSAQRRMIEARSRDSNVLALNYARFEFESKQAFSQVDINYHLRNIVRICLVGLLMNAYERGLGETAFSGTEREQIKALARFYLLDMNQEEIIEAVNSIIGLLGRARDYVENNLHIVNAFIEGLLSKAGFGAINPQQGQLDAAISKPSKNHLEMVVSIIKTMGFDSVYILVDKVDEIEYTMNNAAAAFELLRPLLTDLDILQMNGLGIKFFLWNEILPFYQKNARPDRIAQYQLDWNPADLKKILQLRLQAYSSGNPVRFIDMLDPSMGEGVNSAIEQLLFTFAQGSPRDIIRICRQMVSEQLRINPYSGRIGIFAATEGFNKFCNDRAKEVVSVNALRELQKVHRLDFTVPYVANEILKIDTNSARAKIKAWEYAGVVKYVDDLKTSHGKKPVHHYAVIDSRIAKAIFPELSFVDFLPKVKTCSRCGTYIFRDWDISTKQRCHICELAFE